MVLLRIARNGLFPAVFLLLAYQIGNAQKPDWFVTLTKIQPGVSRKPDIEELFKDAKKAGESNEVITYFTKEGRLTVTFATGKSTPLYRENCSIESGTVIEALLSFDKIDRRPEIEPFGLERSNYEILTEADNPTQHFINKDSGLDFHVDRGHVLAVKVFHPAVYERIKRFIRASGG
jgi:hypothetical protein